MSILIAGGSGLIGASLTQMIVELEERPTIFDIAPIHPILRKIDSKFKYFQGSLDNLPELSNIIKTEAIDTIFHLGGMLSKGVLAKSNAELMEKVVEIAQELGREIVTPDEARKILRLKGKNKVNY
jgi:UDP-glucose 4-epimerase